MEHLEIILPITILVLAFVLKLSIDRNVEVPNLIKAICELPVDIIFLSISFLIAFTISKPGDPSEGLFYCISFIVLAAVVVILWRKSLNLFEKGKNYWWILLLCLNMILSVFSLMQSTNILLSTEKQEDNKTEKVEPKTEENGH